MLVWAIDETVGFDSTWATISGTRLVADGRAVGLRPTSHRTTYQLKTGVGFVTEVPHLQA